MNLDCGAYNISRNIGSGGVKFVHRLNLLNVEMVAISLCYLCDLLFAKLPQHSR